MTTNEVLIPASASHKHIAFKVIATAQHMAASLDNVVYQTTLGVHDSELASFDIYPNPSTDRNIIISYANIDNSIKNNISVYSITGAKVFETEIATDSNTNTKNINLSGLTAGVYIFKLQSDQKIVTKKLLLR